jgi:hypothetical protein
MTEVMLPSRRVVTLTARPGLTAHVRVRGYEEIATMVEAGDVEVRDASGAVAVGEMALGDFHALRAIATRLGWIEEETIDFACRNCGEKMAVAPCSRLELGPFEDRELDDPGLDRTIDLAVAHPIPDVKLLGGETAREVRFEAVTVSRAAPLHRARRLVVTAKIVRAMGIASLGPEKNPARIAHALARSSEEAWCTITDLFLDAHYPPRLMAIAVCPACGARNDVDAPYDREFLPWRGATAVSNKRDESNAESFPTFDAFDARARAIAQEILGPDAHREVALVVDGGVPAVDDGGEPLLGGYVPHAGAPEITVYYQTFRAVWDEEGPYAWEDEVYETIEHEFEHHTSHGRGYDAMDDEERLEIRDEAARVRGRKALAREALGGLRGDFIGFLRRTWIVWLIILVAVLIVSMSER